MAHTWLKIVSSARHIPLACDSSLCRSVGYEQHTMGLLMIYCMNYEWNKVGEGLQKCALTSYHTRYICTQSWFHLVGSSSIVRNRSKWSKNKFHWCRIEQMRVWDARTSRGCRISGKRSTKRLTEERIHRNLISLPNTYSNTGNLGSSVEVALLADNMRYAINDTERSSSHNGTLVVCMSDK